MEPDLSAARRLFWFKCGGVVKTLATGLADKQLSCHQLVGYTNKTHIITFLRDNRWLFIFRTFVPLEKKNTPNKHQTITVVNYLYDRKEKINFGRNEM